MATLYATIANSPQVPICDNRLCENHLRVVQGGVDRQRIVDWMTEQGLNNRQLAELLGVSEDKVSKSLSTTGKPRRWQGDEVIRLLELMNGGDQIVRTEVRGTGMSAEEVRQGWLLRGNVKPVPLVGSASGGDWDEMTDVELTELRLAEVLDYLGRPPSIAGDDTAYAVEIVGESMVPRFEPGERVFVSPKSPVRPGDDVIVQLTHPTERDSQAADAVTDVLIKRFVRRTSSFVELRQFNPEQTFQVPLARIARAGGRLAIHRVQGRL